MLQKFLERPRTAGIVVGAVIGAVVGALLIGNFGVASPGQGFGVWGRLLGSAWAPTLVSASANGLPQGAVAMRLLAVARAVTALLLSPSGPSRKAATASSRAISTREARRFITCSGRSIITTLRLAHPMANAGSALKLRLAQPAGSVRGSERHIDFPAPCPTFQP